MSVMKKMFFVVLVLNSLLLSQQCFERTYAGAVDDRGSNVIQTPDDGFLVSAWSKTVGFGGWDVFLMKTDANGDTLWTKGLGGSGDDCCEGLLKTDDNGFLLAANTTSKGAGQEDILLYKLDQNGNIDWETCYGTSRYEHCFDLIPIADGYILSGISGISNSVSAADYQAFILCIDKAGTELWSKSYGGSYNDYFRHVVATKDGGYAFCGGSTTSRSIHAEDLFLFKTDKDGNKIWERTYGNPDMRDAGFALIETRNGDLVVAGRTYAVNPSDQDLYLVKTKANGDTLWTRALGGSEWEIGFDLVELDDGTVVIVGSTTSYGAGGRDIYLIKVDSEGDVLWEKTFGGEYNDEGIALNKTHDGGLIITGNHYLDATGNRSQIWLIKTTADGNVTSIDMRDNEYIAAARLVQNFPNPFNASTMIQYCIPVTQRVNLSIFDIQGRKISTLVNGIQTSGTHVVNFDAGELTSGIYLYKLTTDQFQESKRLSLIK